MAELTTAELNIWLQITRPALEEMNYVDQNGERIGDETGNGYDLVSNLRS